jgi:hypothetical protein
MVLVPSGVAVETRCLSMRKRVVTAGSSFDVQADYRRGVCGLKVIDGGVSRRDGGSRL